MYIAPRTQIRAKQQGWRLLHSFGSLDSRPLYVVTDARRGQRSETAGLALSVSSPLATKPLCSRTLIEAGLSSVTRARSLVGQYVTPQLLRPRRHRRTPVRLPRRWATT